MTDRFLCPDCGEAVALGPPVTNAAGDEVNRYVCAGSDGFTSDWFVVSGAGGDSVRVLASADNQFVRGAVKVTNPAEIGGGSSGGDVAIKDGVLGINKLAVDALGRIGIGNFPATQPVSGPLTDTQLRAGPLATTLAGTVLTDFRASDKHVTAVAAVNTLTTLTLPLAAGQFHYVTGIKIAMFSTAARTGTATPVTVTTTNLPGNPAFTFPSAGAIGTVFEHEYIPASPLRSVAAGLATTVVAPATASVIWRINVSYFTA